LSPEAKVAALRRPDAYAGRPQTVEVVETHMSWVFLTPEHAYKMKKPVRYDGLDFSTLATRRFYCSEELRLNRRLTTDVYLDVVALRADALGALRIATAGAAVEWLVMMRRLPNDRMLDHLLYRPWHRDCRHPICGRWRRNWRPSIAACGRP
jgi:aminoglycoside phosphotransferase family enzyme